MLAGCATIRHNHSEARPQGWTVPSVLVNKHIYAPGEDIKVSFSNGPGNKGDWIGIYSRGVKPGSAIFSHLFLFSDGTNAVGEGEWIHPVYQKGVATGKKGVSHGQLLFDIDSQNWENPDVVDWPLAEGDYDVYFFCCWDNGVLAGPAEFTIDSGDGK
jgi:hypothetical protein